MERSTPNKLDCLGNRSTAAGSIGHHRQAIAEVPSIFGYRARGYQSALGLIAFVVVFVIVGVARVARSEVVNRAQRGNNIWA